MSDHTDLMAEARGDQTMTKDRIKDSDPIMIVDDCMDHVDRALTS